MEEKEVNWEQDYKDLLGVCINSKNRIEELEEENKKLKVEKDKLYIDYENLSNCNADLIQENNKLKERIKELEEQRIFSLWEYDYMILTSTTPQLKLIKKNNSDLCSNITVWTTQK